MNEEQLQEFNAELENGQDALNDKNFIEAWDHLYKAYTLKNEFFKRKRVNQKNIDDEDFAKTCYLLAQVIKETTSKDELIEKLTREDEELIANKYKGAKARRFIGRKYLKLAADKDYSPAIVEYSLNCIGYAPQGKLDYEYNQNNLETALYWANSVMKKHKNTYVSAMGYCIHAIYCLDQYKNNKDEEALQKFGDYILQADASNEGKFDQYIAYHLGYLYSFPKLENYESGKYFSYAKGIDMFEQVIKKGSDSYLIRNAKKLKEAVEKYNN